MFTCVFRLQTLYLTLCCLHSLIGTQGFWRVWRRVEEEYVCVWEGGAVGGGGGAIGCTE